MIVGVATLVAQYTQSMVILQQQMRSRLGTSGTQWKTLCDCRNTFQTPEDIRRGCGNCEGTGRDPIPWAELFKKGRQRE